jgi:hypothetical protein
LQRLPVPDGAIEPALRVTGGYQIGDVPWRAMVSLPIVFEGQCMKVEPVEVFLERLLSIQWTERHLRRESQARLLEEHARRVALWRRRFGAGWYFADLAAVADSSVRASEDVLHRLHEGVSIHLSGYALRVCEYALHYAALQKAGKCPADLPDPFEPLIVLFERGSIFSRDGAGYIDVDGLGVRLRNVDDYLQDEPRAPVDPEQLNDIDWRVLEDDLVEEVADLEAGAEVDFLAPLGTKYRRCVLLSWNKRELVVSIVDRAPAESGVMRSMHEAAQKSASMDWQMQTVGEHNELQCRIALPPSEEQLRQVVEALTHVLRRGYGVEEANTLRYRALQRESGEKLTLRLALIRAR